MQLKERVFNGVTTSDITKREISNRDLSRSAAEEGFALLKNEDHILPIKKGTKLGLYGAGAVQTIKGGTGSGDVNVRDNISIFQGLKNAGYKITSETWLEEYDDEYKQSRLFWKASIIDKIDKCGGNWFEAYSSTQFIFPCGSMLDEKACKQDGADTAIYVLSRIAGENADRHNVDGDYKIAAKEKEILAQISRVYKNVVLVINTGGLVDLSFVDKFENIKGIFQFLQAGQEGGHAFANVLSGDITPSGKLTDTWALSYEDYPNAKTFSHMNGDTNMEKYEEGIYVGYRYFDTFDVPVRYCFGYGLSYTKFAMKATAVRMADANDGNPVIETRISLKNIGDTYAGKEVAQVYVSCPQAAMEKEFRRLVGFKKTDVLKPGQEQELKITFTMYHLASYSEKKAAWILDKGTYGIWVGNSLEDAKLVGTICLYQDKVMVQCKHICKRVEPLHELHQNAKTKDEKAAKWLKVAESLELPAVTIKAEDIKTKTIAYSKGPGWVDGKAGEIVEQLSVEQMISLSTGEVASKDGVNLGSAGITVPGAAAETSSIAKKEPWNLASLVLADGPAGLRLTSTYQVKDGKIIPQNAMSSIENGFFSEPEEVVGTKYYQYATAIPVGALLAQTWNTELIREVGKMIGQEMLLFQVTLWLAPGMNIHRNPLCGRNFEYYSEDPLISGLMARAMTNGVQEVPGCGTTIKHFACNNQEDNRMGSDSILSERALREIYMKGFEITIKQEQPMSIMTSYNMINGVHAANCYELCTMAARDEWGFEGVIMTDWYTTTGSTRGVCTAAGCILAGNDMIMPGSLQDHDSIRKALKDGSLSLERLKECVGHSINIILKSNQYEGAVSYRK